MTDLVHKEETAVIIPQQTEALTPLSILQQAVASGADASQIEKLMDLQERHEAREAEKAYNAAMTQFKTNPPAIIKTKNGHNCKYAPLSEITRAVNDAMATLGLSFTWTTGKAEGKQIEVICVIRHVLGHSEQTALVSDPENSGKKNDVQSIGSAVTYLQRYTLMLALGLAASDDDDGISSAQQFESISDDDVIAIAKAADSKGLDIEIIKTAYNITDLRQIPKNKYAAVMDRINKSGGK